MIYHEELNIYLFVLVDASAGLRVIHHHGTNNTRFNVDITIKILPALIAHPQISSTNF